MNTPTIASSEFPALNARFWNMIHEQFLPLLTETLPEHMLVANSAGYPHIAAEITKRIAPVMQETSRRVEAELLNEAYLFFSSPTRFLLRCLESAIRHSEAVKRECMGSAADAPPAWYPNCPFNWRRHDAEKDIELTRQYYKEHRERIFGLEISFLDALESGKLEDAETFLAAIKAKRRESDTLNRGEANNWQFELAVKKGDIPMFLDAWNNRVEGSIVAVEKLAELLQSLLYKTMIAQFAVAPTSEGFRKAAREGQAQWGNAQSATYLRASLGDVSKALLNGGQFDEESFRSFVKSTFEANRRVFTRINPQVADIRAIWK